MPEVTDTLAVPAEHLAARRARVAEIRAHARHLFDRGATGIQVAAAISEGIERFVVELFHEALAGLSESKRRLVDEHAALVAIGGSGRGDLAPYSDVDLLFCYHGNAAVADAFGACAAQVVRDCWDAGVRLGHAVRSVSSSIAMARSDLQIATGLVEARCLAGNRSVVERLRRDLRRRVARGRARTFIDACLEARLDERQEFGAAVGKLEPDVKRALGGLRDLHLIRWAGYACFGTSDLDSLRLEGAFQRDEARRLLAAWEFLTRVRVDLHFEAGKPQDVLTREEQLRLAESREITGTAGLRPVELFMQAYFRHSTTIAQLSQRFVERHRPRTLAGRLMRKMLTHRADGIFKVGPDAIDVVPRHRREVCGSLEQVLRLFQLSSRYGVGLSTELTDAIRHASPEMSRELTDEAVAMFVEILSRGGNLDRVLRAMFDIGILELVIPDFARAHCLLQFNQYHSYTVDEHTLRTIDAVTALADDESSIGAAYRDIHHKEILHLALLLHDIGKGLQGDHSELGEEIAERIGYRLQLSEHATQMLKFLVRHHLLMAHLAFRRDMSEPSALLQFSHHVGTPETLRMLYVLTVADITAVGPGVWTEWKAELLTDLYDRTMQVLGGQRPLISRRQQLADLKDRVRAAVVPLDADPAHSDALASLEDFLAAFPDHYLMNTPPHQIASDLDVLRSRKPGEIAIDALYDEETQTLEYRVITHETTAPRSSHRIAGVLAAKGMEIISAQLTTSQTGNIIDSFRVVDEDYEGPVPQVRIEEVKSAVESVLRGERSVRSLFKAHRRFGATDSTGTTSALPMRVSIDNDSSECCTVIEVFAHDRPGLLYTILRTLFDSDLSIEQAKIATHLDQVVDVFYVTDSEGRKIKEESRLTGIREDLEGKLTEFEERGYVQFV